MGTLTIAGIKAISEPGRYIDGDGLMLRVTESGSKNWILRVRIEGERRDVGLGSFKVVTLAEAREKAREYRRLIAQGVDPVAEKKKVADPVPTFRDAATHTVRGPVLLSFSSKREPLTSLHFRLTISPMRQPVSNSIKIAVACCGCVPRAAFNTVPSRASSARDRNRSHLRRRFWRMPVQGLLPSSRRPHASALLNSAR